MTDQKFDEKKSVLRETLNDVRNRDDNTLVETDQAPSDGQGRAPLTGIVLDGKYEVGELIGRGGMSVVYRARHLLLNKPVAIKFLHPHLTHDENAFRRFQKEAKAVTSLTHDGIIHVYDFGQLPDGQPYLAMELLEGQSLADVISKSGSLNRQNALALFKAIAKALEYAHDKGVIHRDLKPSNVVLDKSGDVARAKVVDFGIAKFEDEASVKLTATGEIFGSPPYMSPEQCRGEALDNRSDIYSMGCLMYEALTGRAPFVGSTSFHIMQMHIGDSPASFSAVRPGLKDCFDLEAAVLKCLAKDPANRFQSARELSVDLEKLEESSEHKFGGGLAGALKLQKARSGTRGRSGTFSAATPIAILVSVLFIAAFALILHLVSLGGRWGSSESGVNKVGMPNGSWMNEHRKGIELMNRGSYRQAFDQFASSAKIARAQPELARSLVVNLSNQLLCAHILQDRAAEKKCSQLVLNAETKLRGVRWSDSSAVESLKLLWSSQSLQATSNPEEIRQLVDRSKPLLAALHDATRSDEALPIIEVLQAKCEMTLSPHDPRLADVLFLKSQALLQVAENNGSLTDESQKMISDALQLLQRCTFIREKNDRGQLPKTLTMLARAQFQGSTSLDEAAQTISKALSMFDSSSSQERGYALFIAARIHSRTNEIKRALEEYRAACAIFAEEERLVLMGHCISGEATLLVRVDGAKKAREFFVSLIKSQVEEGKALEPLTGEYYAAFGNLLYADNMFESAIPVYQRALEIDQMTQTLSLRERKTLDHLIRCLMQTGDYSQVLSLTQQMTAIDELGAPSARSRKLIEEDRAILAWIYTNIGKRDEAQKLLKERLARINSCAPDEIMIDDWLIDLARKGALTTEQREVLLNRAKAYVANKRLRKARPGVIARGLQDVADLQESLGMKDERLETLKEAASEVRKVHHVNIFRAESVLNALAEALRKSGSENEAQAIEAEIAQLKKGQ